MTGTSHRSPSKAARRRPRRLRLSLLAALPALATFAGACGDTGAAGDAATVTVRDSAGVTIVESGAIGAAPPAELGAPLLDIGAVDGPAEYLLSWVGAAALLADGGLAVADGSRRVRFYEADGSYVGAFGREGSGPGEFRGIHGLWPRGDDTLVALDGRQWRLTVFAGGALVSTHPVRPPGMNPPGQSGMLADGSVVVREMLFEIPESGFEPVPVIARRLTLDGEPPDTVLTGQGPRFGPVHWSDGGSIVASPLFEPGLTIGAGGERLVAADCREPEFRELASDGTLLRIVRWNAGDRTVRDEHVARLRQARLEGAEDAEDRRRMEELFAARPVNDVFPACAAVFTPDGRDVWVQSYWYLQEGTADWRVFRDGEFVGALRLPVQSRIMAVRGDRIALVERDALEVEHVRVYELPERLAAPHGS